jgi:hypothetical protein
VRRGGRHLTIDVVALQVRVAAAAEGLPAASKDLRAFADVLAPQSRVSAPDRLDRLALPHHAGGRF